MTRNLLAVLLMSLWFVSSTAARDIYVDNVVGDDRHDGSLTEEGGERGGPCRTIRRALKLVQRSDRVVLVKTDVPYRESITLQAALHSGTGQKPFEIVGNGAVLDGTQEVPRESWTHVSGDVYRYRPPRTSFQMLYLGGRPAKRVVAAAGAGLPALAPLEWCLYAGQIHFRAEAYKLPRQYELYFTDLTVGITLYDVHDLVISDLVVQGFQLDGINLHDNVFAAQLRGLTCRGNGRSGISVGGASQVRMEECLLGDNGSAQLRTEGNCHAEVVDCELLENTAPAVVKEGGQVSLGAGTRIER